MRAERRRWLGGWPSIIAVFTVLTVAALSIWLITGRAEAPRPDANNDMPIVPQPVSTTPSAAPSPVTGGRKSPSASPSASPSSKPPTHTTPPEESAPVLKASYDSAYDWFNNLDSEITLTNPGTKDVVGWTVVLVLPKGMTVMSARDATFNVDGDTVTFTPSTDDTVSAHDDFVFSFHGAGPQQGPARPVSCTVNGVKC
ncbi:hypothetical protein Afil01_10360 [Actinorhabdospora filicis]|uniref:CBM2 domain-containing protein n=1 Tax=Actinorhabdospora filicis TaxID=1785913 RepID=A0A9W6SFJ3_9ACTN|nr:cellulose binding domain-containing protein [Actinorhabdospora filicis]GLZ76229.1 hypothetical protein Afil01_10360 [Actinorhabdospora filicis]